MSQLVQSEGTDTLECTHCALVHWYIQKPGIVPDEHWARSGWFSSFWIHGGGWDADQHHIVLANPGGGDLGGEEDIEENVAKVGVCSDQQLVFLSFHWLDVQHAHSFLHIASIFLEEQLAFFRVFGVVLCDLFDLDHWWRIFILISSSL